MEQSDLRTALGGRDRSGTLRLPYAVCAILSRCSLQPW